MKQSERLGLGLLEVFQSITLRAPLCTVCVCVGGGGEGGVEWCN